MSQDSAPCDLVAGSTVALHQVCHPCSLWPGCWLCASSPHTRVYAELLIPPRLSLASISVTPLIAVLLHSFWCQKPWHLSWASQCQVPHTRSLGLASVSYFLVLLLAKIGVMMRVSSQLGGKKFASSITCHLIHFTQEWHPFRVRNLSLHLLVLLWPTAHPPGNWAAWQA